MTNYLLWTFRFLPMTLLFLHPPIVYFTDLLFVVEVSWWNILLIRLWRKRWCVGGVRRSHPSWRWRRSRRSHTVWPARIQWHRPLIPGWGRNRTTRCHQIIRGIRKTNGYSSSRGRHWGRSNSCAVVI